MQENIAPKVTLVRFVKMVLLNKRIVTSFFMYCAVRVTLAGILFSVIPTLYLKRENLDLAQYLSTLAIVIYMVFLPLYIAYRLLDDWKFYGSNEENYCALRKVGNYKKWLRGVETVYKDSSL